MRAGLHALTSNVVVLGSWRCYVSCNTVGGAPILTFRMKGLRPFFLAVAILFSFSVLQSQEKQASSGTLKIGFLIYSFKTDRWHTNLNTFQTLPANLRASSPW